MSNKIRVWDAPLRVFHWALVLAVAAAIVSAKAGAMLWHGRAGLVVLGLLVFRLLWGLVGSTPARFAQFAPSRARLRAWWRGQWHGLGHNPLGALAVFAMLLLLAAQAGSGLFANDEIDFSGPLSGWLSSELVAWLTRWHHRVALALYWLLGLHVTAIGFYTLIKKRNLIGPMLTGWHSGPLPPGVALPVAGSRVGLWLAVVLALVLPLWLLPGLA
jgi:cytochrome b